MLTVTYSTISGNSGDGIYNVGGLGVTNSTISGNSGDGINMSYNGSSVAVTNSTIVANSGSGINDDSPFDNAYVTNCTIFGGINVPYGHPIIGQFVLENSIVDTVSAPLGWGIAYNLIISSMYTGGLVNGVNGNQVGVNPGLGPLTNNGGPTQTIALLPGSPAIDRGDNALAAGDTDQRGPGFVRIVNGTVDIGAFEFLPAANDSVSVGWGTQTASLQTAADGLRLLPAGRNTDLPWLGINRLQVTLSQAYTLTASDVTVNSAIGVSYGPVTVSGSGISYMITLAQPMNAADQVTITIVNPGVSIFNRRLDVLPGDVNDDGVVNVQDMVLIRNQMLGFLGAVPTIFGDINGDGKVDINDYTAVRMRIGTHW